MRDYRDGVKQFLRSAPSLPFDHVPLSPIVWASDPGRWARSGSSDGPRLEVEIRVDGKWRASKAKKSKWASALAMDENRLRKALFSWEFQHNKAVQKRELQKVRAVIAGDLDLYLKMSYVSYWLEERLRGHVNSTLLMSAKQVFQLWVDMGKSTEQTSVKMPLDQSEFDYQPDQDMIRVCVEEIREMVRDEVTPYWYRDELITMCDRIIYAISGGDILVGHIFILYIKGVMSGWRWTALIDTLVNAGELHVARQAVIRRVGVDPVTSWVAQGDDDRIVCPTYGCAVMLWSVYVEMGLEVNPAKFFIRQDSDELLRQVAFKGVVHGYPARAVPSLVFRNPVTRELFPGEERMREMITSWAQVFNRVGEYRWELAINDVANSNRVSKDVVRRFIITPAAMGGMGFRMQFNEKWCKVTKGKVTKHVQLGSIKIASNQRAVLVERGISEEDYARYLAKNLDYPDSTDKTFKRFEVVEMEPDVRPWKHARLITDEGGFPLAARACNTIPPTIASIVKEQLMRRPDLELSRWWLAKELKPYADWVWTRFSRAVWIDWIGDKLPYKTPQREGWSPAACSVIYKGLALYQWHSVISRSSETVKANRVRRSAVTAESLLDAALIQQDYRVGG